MKPAALVLYDLTGKPYEVDHVSAVLWFDNFLQYTIEKPDEVPYNVSVPLHRVHEVRYP